MTQFLTFDIGGTDIKYGLITEEATLIESDSMPTNAHNGGPSIINRIIDTINDYKTKYKISGVAISTAGVIDPFKGEVINATDAIPQYIGVKIKEMIETNTSLPTEVQNDVNCFALCEGNLGNAKGCNNFITLTIGTGVGGAIYVNDSMVYGHNFSAGEWGRMKVIDKKFEEVASITGLINIAKEHINDQNLNGKKIFELYDSGYQHAKEAVETFYHYLSTGISNLIYIFNPEKVIIGGGITGRGQRFLDELNEFMKSNTDLTFLNNTTIELAKFNNQSGMIGALYHFLHMQANK